MSHYYGVGKYSLGPSRRKCHHSDIPVLGPGLYGYNLLETKQVRSQGTALVHEVATAQHPHEVLKLAQPGKNKPGCLKTGMTP